MCGISGIINFKSEDPEIPAWITNMSSLLKHRGPDDEGYAFFSKESIQCTGGNDTPSEVWESRFPFSPGTFPENNNPYLALGHRRLSILDTSPAGHQPMCDATQRYWIVFNGEIYNFEEVKKELQQTGCSFFSHCDTEVIIQAYIKWGKNCVHKFNGMWAFVLYDAKEKLLFCSRDRFGVKPFYYYFLDGYFAFASEIKALLTLPFIAKKLNENAVFDYLVLGQTELEQEGFFKDIIELPPSHNLLIRDNSLTKEKYYSLQTEAANKVFSASSAREHIAQTSHLINEAVKIRLRSDVPVGACLSGGIDSSSLVCTTNLLRKSTEPFHVFTSVFPGQAIDEAKWAKIVVEAASTQWHTIETTGADLIKDYEDLVYCQDIPFFGSSTLSQAKVMQLINKTGIKVTLDGQGADELFSGYPQHFYMSAYSGLKNLQFTELNYLERAEANAGGYFLKFLFKNAVQNLPSKLHYKWLKSGKYDFQLLRQEFWDKNEERYGALRPRMPASLNEMLKTEFQGAPLKYLMRTADRNSMRYSVESRVPFADDHLLAEYVFSVPSVYKIRKGESKYLLRESMRNVIPDSIRLRKDKKGFATPESRWFRELNQELKEMITDNIEPFVNTNQLKKDWDQIITGNTFGLSRFLILSLWRKKFGV